MLSLGHAVVAAPDVVRRRRCRRGRRRPARSAWLALPTSVGASPSRLQLGGLLGRAVDLEVAAVVGLDHVVAGQRELLLVLRRSARRGTRSAAAGAAIAAGAAAASAKAPSRRRRLLSATAYMPSPVMRCARPPEPLASDTRNLPRVSRRARHFPSGYKPADAHERDQPRQRPRGRPRRVRAVLRRAAGRESAGHAEFRPAGAVARARGDTAAPVRARRPTPQRHHHFGITVEDLEPVFRARRGDGRVRPRDQPPPPRSSCPATSPRPTCATRRAT